MKFDSKMLSKFTFYFSLLYLVTIKVVSSHDVDPLGYILYCPCMGRFGNQADHFLGALGFAHGLNRTLVLPPWVEYRYGQPRSIQVPFDKYFKVAPLEKFHKVITMHKFMEEIAPFEWPESERVSFCYVSRGTSNDCNAKEGNPFGPFWDTFNVDFVNSEFYNPLHYDTYHHNMAKQWLDRYPPSKRPVLAFTGAPASFPVQFENRHLHQYLEWSDEISHKTDNFIKKTLPQGAFVAIHLRNGVDWVRACEHVPESPNLFAAPQCLGYMNEKGRATMEMCLPSQATIIRQLKRVIKKASSDNVIKSVFVSSDNNHMIAELNEALKRIKIQAFKYDGNEPHVDLAIMGRANYFIGNCISSFSAFVKRERDVKGFPSSFWAFPPEKGSGGRREHVKEEL